MPNFILPAAVGVTAYVAAAAMAHTYIYSKAKKDRLSSSYAVLAFLVLLWPALKLLSLVAPSEGIRDGYFAAECVCAILLFILSCFFIVTVRGRKRIGLHVMVTVLLAAAGYLFFLVVYFMEYRAVWSVWLLLMMMSVLSVFLFAKKDVIFPEIEISLDNIAEHADDRVAVFSMSGELVDRNLKALGAWAEHDPVDSLEGLIRILNAHAPEDKLDYEAIAGLTDGGYEKELCIQSEGRTCYYIFSADRLRNARGADLGTVCFMRDITESRLLSMELEQKNQELRTLNKELKSYLKIADHLAEEKERAQIAGEINRVIGQRLAEILSVLEVLKLTEYQSPEQFERLINDSIDNCRAVLAEVRVVVSSLLPDKKTDKIGRNADD